jgi:AcrR family transcriptional regulator
MLSAMPDLPRALARTAVGADRISPEAHAQERRREILGLVTGVFAKRGYHGATIDHLVAGGKTSMGGFYKFFEGKEDCFVQAFDQVVEEARGRLGNPDAGGEWAMEVSAGLRSLLEFTAEKPLSARLVLLEAQSGGPDAVRRYDEVLDEAASVLRACRSAAQKPPELPESFEDATVNGVVWLMQKRLARGEEIDVDDLHPQLMKLVLEPYLGRPALERMRRAG